MQKIFFKCYLVFLRGIRYKPSARSSDGSSLTLHADHEQNASTSTVRFAGSSGANPFACIAAGIASLWGPAHGGANEAVLNMLNEIGNKSRVGEYVKKAKDKDDPPSNGLWSLCVKTMIKSNSNDAKLSRGIRRFGINDPLLELAMELEKLPVRMTISWNVICIQTWISFWNNPKSNGVSIKYVHSFICSCANNRLDSAMERNG